MTTFREFKPKNLAEKLMGKAIWDMCESIEQNCPDEDEQIIKKGLSRMFWLFFLMGVLCGGIAIAGVFLINEIGTALFGMI